MNVIVFDFDKTLTYHDTWNDFIIFAGKERKKFWLKYTLYVIAILLQKTRLISNICLKKISVFLFLNGFNIDQLEKVAGEFAGHIKLNDLYHQNFSKINDSNDDIIVISASLQIYIKYVIPGVKLFATELDTKSGKVKGLKRHISGKGKREILNHEGIEKIKDLYTDSISDLSLAEISENIKLVVDNQIIECKSINDFKHKYYSHRKIKSNILNILLGKYQNI